MSESKTQNFKWGFWEENTKKIEVKGYEEDKVKTPEGETIQKRWDQPLKPWVQRLEQNHSCPEI